jgi:glycosyltransferase involved in cell wall biosynthesis
MSRSALFRGSVDLSRFPADSLGIEPADRREGGPQTLLFYGPFTQEGGLDLVVEAAVALRSCDVETNVAALLDGRLDDRYLARVRRWAVRLALDLAVETSVPARRIPMWFTRADAVVLPCRQDVGAEAAMLAAAARRPFVGAEVESLLETVDERATGVLVPCNDVKALVRALQHLAGDREEAARLGRAARTKLESEMSPRAATERLRELWRDAISRRLLRAPAVVSTS